MYLSLAIAVIIPTKSIITAISKSCLISFFSFSGTWIKTPIITVTTAAIAMITAMIEAVIVAYASAAIITAIISTTTPVTTETSTYITHDLFPLFVYNKL
ncbi:hypothetical protein [Hungatella effluvii]|uniref:hypothetical protein n=1 Tax=Hungatella effluvii TaxID=1096246 RepID=UPI002A801065|nr:hypothetical protein [Hungatella effluvii]